jgi:hypothetical protein
MMTVELQKDLDLPLMQTRPSFVVSEARHADHAALHCTVPLPSTASHTPTDSQLKTFGEVCRLCREPVLFPLFPHPGISS